MKKITIIIIAVLIVAISSFKQVIAPTQKKYLPVCVEIKSPISDSFMAQLFFKSAFKKYNIEAISKKMATEIKNLEIQRVSYDYFSSAQSPSNDEMQNYIARNMDYKVNNVLIKFTLDSLTNKFAAFEWMNIAIPLAINRDLQKKTWKKTSLESSRYLALNEIIQVITDSIVASGKLYKE